MGIADHPHIHGDTHCDTNGHLIYKVTVAYDGTAFCGWQVQPRQRTVQGVLQKCLSEMAERPIIIHGSGRTDSGVHGIGQVFHFSGPFPIPVDRLVKACNTQLPFDVALQYAEEAPLDFHARYSVIAKTYRYRICTAPDRDPLRANQVWFTGRDLNLDAMIEAGEFLKGTHDFASFAASGSPRDSTVRTIQSITMERYGDEIHMEFTADGFLYHMVRNLAGTLADVGRMRSHPEAVSKILEAKNRSKAGKTAPACGLYLLHVQY